MEQLNSFLLILSYFILFIHDMAAFTTLAATMSNIIPNCKDTYDRLMLYQETLRPAADVQYIVEQYRTGRYCPRPILYVDFHNRPRQGKRKENVFGESTSFLVHKTYSFMFYHCRSPIWDSTGGCRRNL